MTSEPANEPTHPRLKRFLLYCVPYLLLAYILSAGPLYWQIQAAFCARGSKILYYFYFPLVAANEIEYVRNFYDWYLQYWI